MASLKTGASKFMHMKHQFNILFLKKKRYRNLLLGVKIMISVIFYWCFIRWFIGLVFNQVIFFPLKPNLITLFLLFLLLFSLPFPCLSLLLPVWASLVQSLSFLPPIFCPSISHLCLHSPLLPLFFCFFLVSDSPLPCLAIPPFLSVSLCNFLLQ